MRKFEKISFLEFKKYYGDDIELYNEYLLPTRATRYSAGYDFKAIKDIVIHPGEIVKIPTGVKAAFKEDEVLLLVVRSSMGFKYNVRMTNQVGVIESDYYNNMDNEGQIFVSLQNEGDKEYIINKNSAFGQGIFTKFLIVDDDCVNTIRTGGIGSTDKEEK